MDNSWFRILKSEPYRIFFPVGVVSLLWGTLIWLPQIWNPGSYPVLTHRYLMLNGFTASFIAGFLMTAVPRFSATFPARTYEIAVFSVITTLGLLYALFQNERMVLVASAMQAGSILMFVFLRILKRQANPPYSFVFIFVGLFLWIISSLAGIFLDLEAFKSLHYEGAIAAIILGVGGRLIPGILGHVEVITEERQQYEKNVPILSTVPLYFFFIVMAFVGSYFVPGSWGNALRALVVTFIGLRYWRLFKRPIVKTALTTCIWIAAWMIVASFLLKAVWTEGVIHASHSFFLGGIVLLSLLVATRVLQSHGPQEKNLENSRMLYLVTFFILLAASTRVSAILMPEQYLSHLGYSSLILALAVIIWAFKYLRYISSKA